MFHQKPILDLPRQLWVQLLFRVYMYLVFTTLVYHILCLSMKLRVLANKDISGHFWQQLSIAIGDIRVQL